MKRITLIWLAVALTFILAAVLPAYAQDADDETPACDPDLDTVISTLEEAHASLDADEISTFLALLGTAQDALADIRVACNPATESGMGEMQTYIAPDGSFQVTYPDALDVYETARTNEPMLFATSDAAAATFAAPSPSFTPGEYAVSVMVGDSSTLIGEEHDSLESLTGRLNEFSGLIGYTAEPLEEQTVNERRAMYFTLSTDEMTGSFLVVELGDGQYAMFIAGATMDTFDTVESTLNAMAESFRLTAGDD